MPPANPSVRLRGEPGFDAGLYYVFDNVATMADPGAGEIRLDNATMASVTAAAISESTYDDGNPDVAAVLTALLSSTGSPLAHIEIFDGNDRANWFRASITGVTDNSGWMELALTYLAHSGTLANGAALRVAITRNGDAGASLPVTGTSTTSQEIATGSKAFTTQSGRGWTIGTRLRAASEADPTNFMEGVVASYSGTALTLTVDLTGGSGTLDDWSIGLSGDTGPTGADGADPGILLTWDDATDDSDPGAGDIKADNADLSSASFLYPSKTGRGGSSIAAFLAGLAASTSTVKGKITLTKTSDETQATFNFTAITDATGYVKLAVSGHSGATGFTAADPVSFQFSRTGDKGDQGDQGDPGAQGDPGSTGAAGVDGASAATRVRVVDTGGGDPSADYEAGDAIDGVTLAENDLVLRATPGGNASDGVYVASASGAASRHGSFDTYDEHPGTIFSVMAGTAYGGTQWQCTSPRGGTLDTTAIEMARGGDVSGPASSTDGNLPEFSGTGGKTLVDSGFSIRDLFNIRGLVPTSNAGDASHDIDIGTGLALSDDGAALIRLSSGITKRLDATFAEGTGNGGMLSGDSLPASGTVHVWLTMKADGTVDVFANNASTDGLSPTPPAGFTYKRRICSLTTDSSNNIVGFTAIETAGGGLDVRLKVPVGDVINSPALSTTTVEYTLPVPLNLNVFVNASYFGFNGSGWRILLQSADDTTTAASSSSPARFSMGNAAGGAAMCHEKIRTNASRQVKAVSTIASTTLSATLFGWTDTRVG